MRLLPPISGARPRAHLKRQSLLSDLDASLDRLKDLLREAVERKRVLEARIEQLAEEIIRLERTRQTALHTGSPLNEAMVS